MGGFPTRVAELPIQRTGLRGVLQELASSVDRWTKEEATAAIIRITQGNFRLLHRLLAQIERIADICVTNTNGSEGAGSVSAGAPPGSPAWNASCCVTTSQEAGTVMRNGEGTTRLLPPQAAAFRHRATVATKSNSQLVNHR
jgi:hypothetical protein